MDFHWSLSHSKSPQVSKALLNMAMCFPVWYFFSVVLSKSLCISFFRPSSSPSYFLVIFFIHSVFLLCSFGCHIFLKIVRFLLHPFVDMFYCHLLPVVDIMLFVVLACPILSVLFYPLSISLLSSFFRLYFLVYFLKLYCYFFLCCFSFLYQRIPASFFCFIILTRFRRFFIVGKNCSRAILKIQAAIRVAQKNCSLSDPPK